MISKYKAEFRELRTCAAIPFSLFFIWLTNWCRWSLDAYETCIRTLQQAIIILKTRNIVFNPIESPTKSPIVNTDCSHQRNVSLTVSFPLWVELVTENRITSYITAYYLIMYENDLYRNLPVEIIRLKDIEDGDFLIYSQVLRRIRQKQVLPFD